MYVLIAEYLSIGAFAGMLAGLLGVGGGIIIIPALIFVFSNQTHIPYDQLMHFVVGTSLASIIVTTLVSLYAQHHRGNFYWSLFLRLLPGVAIGTVLGTILAVFLDTHVLKILFGVFMIIVAVQMLSTLKEGEEKQLPGPISRWIATLFIGMSSGLLGISGGALTIPYLTYFHVPIRQAMAASTACGVVITVTGTVAYIISGWHVANAPAWSTGYIYWPAALAIAFASPLFVNIGAYWSGRLPVIRLRQFLALFIAIVGLQMLMTQA